jgi:phosphoribosylformimino-5-aminoimidazole carboxamide ribonucleotide (ProFAR) isomerase
VVTGLDLLAYRWHGGNVPNLVTAVVQAVAVPVVVAGSIETDRQIAHMRKAGAWGFTIGSAFFDGKFPGDSVRAQLDHVLMLLTGDTEEGATS